jgi:hypothetical protein
MSKQEPTINYTVKEIVEAIHKETQALSVKMDAQGKKLDSVEIQTKLTNGRVNVIEKRSLGVWVYNHPYRFALILLSLGGALTPIMISDFRQPIIAAIKLAFI